MNPKSATAVLGVVILFGGEITLEHRESLVPHEHIHAEMHTDSVATATVPLAVSGQFALDEDGFSPPLPWTDDSHMAAVQAMMRLQWNQEDFAPPQNAESESGRAGAVRDRIRAEGPAWRSQRFKT